MSLHLEMLQVARLAPRILGDSCELVRDYLRGQQNTDGGFRNRNGASDLYYTVFALDSLVSLEHHRSGQATKSWGGWSKTKQYLKAFGGGSGLDFVHLCCLARSWAALALTSGGMIETAGAGFPREECLAVLDRYRSGDGGYHAIPGHDTASAYGCFLALGAHQDCGVPLPDPEGMKRALAKLRRSDGGWSNEAKQSASSTNATAAALVTARQLGWPQAADSSSFLVAQAHPAGGFRAAPGTPLPDLLSTATALHALAGENVALNSWRERNLDYLDSLWTNEGAFHGHWADDLCDVEYTFYGLLALGHLSG